MWTMGSKNITKKDRPKKASGLSWIQIGTPAIPWIFESSVYTQVLNEVAGFLSISVNSIDALICC
jgi:hypothetical protein